MLQNDAKKKNERDHLMLSIDLEFFNQVRTMIESITGKRLRKYSENSDKIIMHLK